MAQPRVRPEAGGPLAIDLLNTTWTGPDGPIDWFDENEAVRAFTATHGHPVARAAVRDTRAALTAARDVVRAVLSAAATRQVDDKLAALVNDALASARPCVMIDDDRLVLSTQADAPGAHVGAQAIVDAVRLAAERPGRVRSCDHGACTIWFVDTSKAGRRRWCSMERCGNRAKAQRHYARQRDGSAA
ncbi:MAG: CGNR zinc finger domain-containing protein [Actinomycetota bacterium]